MAKLDEKPQDYKGPREPIITKLPCGWCMSKDHEQCRHELPYYDKLWICPCECNKGWVPQDLGSATATKKRRTNEVRDVQLPGVTRQSGEASDSSGDLREGHLQDSQGSLEREPDDLDLKASGE